MAKLYLMNFETPGEPEYVLLKAGLFTYARTLEGTRAEPTERLGRFFRGVAPPLETLVPALCRIVYYLNVERGGVLDPCRERVAAMTAMEEIGVGNGRAEFAKLTMLISGVMEQVAEERRNLPPVGNL